MNASFLDEEAFKENCASNARFGGSREGGTPIGPRDGEGIPKKDSLFLHPGSIRTPGNS